MKTFTKFIATCAVAGVALTPMVTKAVSYYPGYTCHYRDISGSCMNYQTSDPYFFQTGTFNPYGNRRTFNPIHAYSVQPSPWDNRYDTYRYEEDDDDNDYLDDDDDGYAYWDRNSRTEAGWKYYYDEDDVFRPYYLESDDDYYHYYDRGDSYFEYEHTRVYIR